MADALDSSLQACEWRVGMLRQLPLSAPTIMTAAKVMQALLKLGASVPD